MHETEFHCITQTEKDHYFVRVCNCNGVLLQSVFHGLSLTKIMLELASNLICYNAECEN